MAFLPVELEVSYLLEQGASYLEVLEAYPFLEEQVAFDLVELEASFLLEVAAYHLVAEAFLLEELVVSFLEEDPSQPL